jgi:hypothetical protein
VGSIQRYKTSIADFQCNQRLKKIRLLQIREQYEEHTGALKNIRKKRHFHYPILIGYLIASNFSSYLPAEIILGRFLIYSLKGIASVLLILCSEEQHISFGAAAAWVSEY